MSYLHDVKERFNFMLADARRKWDHHNRASHAMSAVGAVHERCARDWEHHVKSLEAIQVELDFAIDQLEK